MILLAPRKVQEAYTSTTTTRKLESHGFLDDSHKSRDIERLKRLVEEDEKLKEKEMKEKAKREKELEKQRKAAEEKAKKEKGKGRARGQESLTQPEAPSLTRTETDFSNLSLNPAQPQTTPGTSSPSSARAAPEANPGVSPNTETQLPGPSANATAPALRSPTISTSSSVTVPVAEPSVPAQSQPDVPTSSNAPSSPTKAIPPAEMQVGPSSHPAAVQIQHSTSTAPSEHRSVSHNHYDFGEEEEEIDEEDEQLGLVPRRRKRTPHNEAYHSLSPESIDSFAAQQDNHSRGFLPWFSGRNASSRTLHADIPYNPPWLSAPSRPNNLDMQMQVVAGLNTSFQGVGLLPTDKEIRETKRRKAVKNQAHDGAKTERKYTKEQDVFADLPDDALYMLLPLWPSEADPVSARDDPFQPPTIPISDRLYALVYYKPWYPPESSGKGKNKDRSKKSRGSPTTSQDGIYIDERNVLMSQFYIGARIVTYDDLEGSNVRVPELGLSVMGSLREAFDTIPINTRPPKLKNKGDKKGKGKAQHGRDFWDYIIGSYHSRDHPMEFYPEGFKKMGLATQTADESEATLGASSVAGPSGSSHAEHSGSGSIREAASNNASTSSLQSLPSSNGRSSTADVNEIAPFDEPDPRDNPALPVRFPPTNEEDPIQEPPIILTPIGRAVLEMAFMGALAVTGFAPQPYW